ncbi:MAG TPA: hypothetical protein VIH93_16400, partial [Thermoanaerobaculia bacterium]
LDRRWLAAASLAAMLGAGLLSLHVMQRTPGPSPARETPPVPGWSALAPRAAAPPASRALGAPTSPEPAAALPAPAPQLLDQVAAPSQPSREETKRRAAAEPSASAPPAASAHQLPALSKEAAPKSAAERDGAPGERRPDEAGRLRKREEGKLAAPPPVQMPKPTVPPPGVAGGLAARPAVPAIPAAPERATAEAELSTAYALEPPEAPQRDALQRAQAQGGGAKADAPANAWAGGAAGAAAGEVEGFASSYDTDAAADRAGWSLAAGGTPLPPPVAGHASRAAPGTRWVRFRLRSTAPAPAGAVRVEIAWSPGAMAWRRLGGRAAPATPESAAPDVFTLAPAALRRGWTAVYEVRLAPDAGAEPDERMATLRVRPVDPDRGPAPRELSLLAADFAPSWMDAAPALRLSCLAAAFAERRLRGAGGDLADLLAAARSLAAETGDRRASDLVVRMLAAQRPSPAGPP